MLAQLSNFRLLSTSTYVARGQTMLKVNMHAAIQTTVVICMRVQKIMFTQINARTILCAHVLIYMLGMTKTHMRL